MMVYDTQNHLVSGLCPSSGILNNYKSTFQELHLFPSSREGKKTPILDSAIEVSVF
jgi:hypothetical protein